MVGSAARAIWLVAGPVIAGAILIVLGCPSGVRSALGWYPFEMRCTARLSSPGRGFLCCCRVVWIDVDDWLWLA